MRTISILILLLILASCKKDKNENMVFSGTVNMAFSSGNAPNIKVVAYGKVYESGSFNTSLKKIKSTYTDQSGKYTLEVPNQNYVELKFETRSDSFFPHTQPVNVDLLEPNEVNEINFSIKPKAELRITVKNAFPFNHQDFAEYTNFRTNFDCFCCQGTPYSFTGIQVDTTFSCFLYGNHYMIYRFRYSRTFTPITDQIDSILCKPFEVTHLQFNY
jgi:hypothetical protein